MTIEDLHPDLLTLALRRLDGTALAAASSATTRLRSLSADPNLWRDLCLSTWPSLRHLHLPASSYRSLFSDAHPFPSSSTSATATTNLPTHLISAVDIYHRGIPILSRIVETDTSTPWSLTSPFRIDVLEEPITSTTAAISPQELTLSWVVINPVQRRVVNVSSRQAVAMDRHWYTGDTLLRFATVVGDGSVGGECAVAAVVACGEAGCVREVSLTVEDMDGMCLSGRDSVMVLQGLMEGGRTVKEGGAAEAGRRYAEHVGRLRRRKERKLRHEGMLDLCCSAVGVALFIAFLVIVFFR